MAKKQVEKKAGILGLIGELFILWIDLSMGIIIGALMLGVGIIIWLGGGGN